MKRLLVVIVLLAFMAAVAFASLTRTNKTIKKQADAKKTEKKETKKKRECKHTCWFSS